MRGIKEDTCHGEHWVLHGIVELLYCAPKNNITLYVKKLELKLNVKRGGHSNIKELYLKGQAIHRKHPEEHCSTLISFANHTFLLLEICSYIFTEKYFFSLTFKQKLMLHF